LNTAGDAERRRGREAEVFPHSRPRRRRVRGWGRAGADRRPVPGAANHADEVAGLRRTGTAMLDLGGGVRAVVERGVLHAER